MPRHVVLVGLPGSGKTTAGRLAAAMLGAPFADVDELVALRAGKSVARIFAEDGEAAFRALEAAAGAELLDGEPAVLAPGGGFLIDPGNRQRALRSGPVIYLRTSPAVAAARLGPNAGRPLVTGLDVAGRLGELLALRETFYRQSSQQVTTDNLTAEEVALAIAELARSGAGW